MPDALAFGAPLHVLLVDPDPGAAALVRQDLATAEASVRLTPVGSLRAALAALRAGAPSCAVTELELPDAPGPEAVRRLRGARPGLPVVVLTSAGSTELAVAAMKHGAIDYVRKGPEASLALPLAVRAAVGRAVLLDVEAGAAAAPGASGGAAPLDDLVAGTTAMRHLLDLVERAAPSDVPVLIEGETGTGKELVARAIHTRGPRRAGPFLVQNCGALSETLLESELFGHVRGAFTGAERERRGLFAEAGDGTVFLDEIGDAPPPVQVKLLRVLQHHEVKAVGADRSYAVRARIVAATNRGLLGEIAAGRFRADLYYRLAVFPLHVPPLRRRAADVPALARRFLARFERDEQRRTGGFAPEALELLRTYPWPGNVRELEHEVHRLVLTVRPGKRIRPHHLAPVVRAGAQALPRAEPLARSLARVELALIRERLEALPTKAAAARSLGITREALYGKLRRLGAPTRGR